MNRRRLGGGALRAAGTQKVRPYVYSDGFKRMDTPQALIKEYFDSVNEKNGANHLFPPWVSDDFEKVLTSHRARWDAHRSELCVRALEPGASALQRHRAHILAKKRSESACPFPIFTCRKDAFEAGAASYREGTLAWDPADTQASFKENMSAYNLLTSRIDYMDRMRCTEGLPHRVRKAATEWLDTHLPLAVHMTLTGAFDDESLAKPMLSPIEPGLTCAYAALDHYMPSLQVHFHQGELPDLITIAPYSGFFGKVAETPFLDDEAKAMLELLIKGSFFKCKTRSIDEILPEKMPKTPVLYHCFVRMLFCTLLGAYSHSKSVQSLECRMDLYEWFSVRGYPTLEETCALVRANKHLDKLVVQEYVLFCVAQIPGLHAHLSDTGEHAAIERATFDCGDRVRERISDNVRAMHAGVDSLTDAHYVTDAEIAERHLLHPGEQKKDVEHQEQPWPVQMIVALSNARKKLGHLPEPSSCFRACVRHVGVRRILSMKNPDELEHSFPSMDSSDLWGEIVALRALTTMYAEEMNAHIKYASTPSWFVGVSDIVIPFDKTKLIHSYTPVTISFIDNMVVSTRKIDDACFGMDGSQEPHFSKDERELLRQHILRLDPSTDISYEWMSVEFGVGIVSIESLKTAERLYVSESSSTEVYNVMKEMAVEAPRDYEALRSFAQELSSRRKVEFYDLDVGTQLAQIEAFQRLYGTEKGQRLHPSAGVHYMCPSCFDFKAVLSEHSKRGTTPLGVISACVDTTTGVIMCKRPPSSVSKRRGTVHDSLRDLNYFAENQQHASRKRSRKERTIEELDRCSKSGLVKVNLLGRMMVIRGVHIIMLCPMCACPTTMRWFKFSEHGFTCGCKEKTVLSRRKRDVSTQKTRQFASKAPTMIEKAPTKRTIRAPPPTQKCEYCETITPVSDMKSIIVYDEKNTDISKRIIRPAYYCSKHHRNWFKRLHAIPALDYIHFAIQNKMRMNHMNNSGLTFPTSQAEEEFKRNGFANIPRSRRSRWMDELEEMIHDPFARKHVIKYGSVSNTRAKMHAHRSRTKRPRKK